MSRYLVLSGGGAHGAFGAGMLYYWTVTQQRQYQKLYGISTGNLLMPKTALASISDADIHMQTLKRAYTTIDNSQLWKRNPFNSKGNIRLFNLLVQELKAHLTGKARGWGDLSPLRQVIRKWFTPQEYQHILDHQIEMFSGIVDLKSGDTIYYSNFDLSYDDFVEIMFASCCFPGVTNHVAIDDMFCVDGGVNDSIPLQAALKGNATDIDIIIHKPKGFVRTEFKPKGGLSQLSQALKIMRNEIVEEDLHRPYQTTHDVKITAVYTPYLLSNNSMFFDSEAMQTYWKLGYQTAQKAAEQDPTSRAFVTKRHLKSNDKNTSL